ncbi:MAG: hypothetical protein IKR81_14370 [Victivallales bacterium]|nr:hypothetical protein [Victivallales bacterium]
MGEASASGASETHGQVITPISFAPCRIAKRSGKAQKILQTSAYWLSF